MRFQFFIHILSYMLNILSISKVREFFVILDISICSCRVQVHHDLYRIDDRISNVFSLLESFNCINVILETGEKNIIPSDVPSTNVGQESILAVRPFRNIWWRNKTVSEFRKMELMSSWEQGGFLDEAAILNGRRKHEIRISNCSTYSSSASTILNTKLKAKRFCL